MFIRNIQIANYRHLRNITLGDFMKPGQASDMVVLAGPNGGGKSSILELISLALSSMWSLTYKLNRTAPQSSFEVEVGLLPAEVALIKEELSKSNVTLTDPYEYLLTRASYCRSFNFSGGEYEKNPTLHNKMHDIVQKILRGSYTRPLGFYLASDRSYVKRGFHRDNIFKYRTYTSFSHIWSYAFQAASDQYADMFDFLVTWRFHFARRLGQYHLKRASGTLDPPDQLPPVDEYGIILDRLFPGYTFVEKEEDAPTDLFIRLPTGEEISFSDLSSGEKEVFFILCFFQRHSVEEAVILVDEPELHLHPSLSRLLVKTMLELKPYNQVWLATQSSEVIDQAGRDKVYFVRRNEDNIAEIVPSTDEDTSLSCLRDFFGYSGYMGLARAMIFTEGRNSSADRKLFSLLIREGSREVKFIPAIGCSEIERINRAILSIIEGNVGWCKFFLIRDRDYLTQEAVEALRSRAGERVFVLERHELENYLLSFDAISRVLNDIYNQSISPASVKAELTQCAYAIAGDVLRDMVSFRLNMKFRPEDFSIPPLNKGELAFQVESGWDNTKLTELQKNLEHRCSSVVNRLGGEVQGHDFNTIFGDCKKETEDALRSDSWVKVFPGKDLLDEFCRRRFLGKPPILRNSIIKELSHTPDDLPAELQSIFGAISSI